MGEKALTKGLTLGLHGPHSAKLNSLKPAQNSQTNDRDNSNAVI